MNDKRDILVIGTLVIAAILIVGTPIVYQAKREKEAALKKEAQAVEEWRKKRLEERRLMESKHENWNDQNVFLIHIDGEKPYPNYTRLFFKINKTFPPGTDFVVHVLDNTGKMVPIDIPREAALPENTVWVSAQKFPKDSMLHRVVITAQNAMTGKIEVSNVEEVTIAR